MIDKCTNCGGRETFLSTTLGPLTPICKKCKGTSFEPTPPASSVGIINCPDCKETIVGGVDCPACGRKHDGSMSPPVVHSHGVNEDCNKSCPCYIQPTDEAMGITDNDKWIFDENDPQGSRCISFGPGAFPAPSADISIGVTEGNWDNKNQRWREKPATEVIRAKEIVVSLRNNHKWNQTHEQALNVSYLDEAADLIESQQQNREKSLQMARVAAENTWDSPSPDMVKKAYQVLCRLIKELEKTSE